MSSFRLTKWYLDCVSEHGDLVIGYSALLQLGLLKFPLAGRLCRIDGRIESSASLTWRWFQPQQETGSLIWNCPKLDIQGVWKPLAAPVRRVLVQDSTGSVMWDCVQPSADVAVRLGDDCEIRGLGYVERMEMTVPPWQLGIRTLQWGRFVSQSESVIWIVWVGERPLSIVFHNGVEVPNGCVEQDQIVLGQDCQLTMHEPQVLRQGVVNNTVLSSIPLVRAVLPKWLRSIDEHKWLCRGQLELADGTLSHGWVIHERVSFDH